MDAPQVKSTVQGCFPYLRVSKVEYLGEGWSNVAWEVGGSLPSEASSVVRVFRFPKRPAASAGLLKEARLLPVLAPLLPIPVPVPDLVWHGAAPFASALVGYPKLPGREMTLADVNAMGCKAAAAALARFLQAVQSFPLDIAPSVELAVYDAAGWLAEYERLLDEVRAKVLCLLPAGVGARMTTAWERFLLDGGQFEPALIHRDLCSEHILFDPESRRISGVIDWEDACFGDPAFDLTGLLDYGPEFVEELLRDSPPRDQCKALAAAHFYRGIVGCHQVLFGLEQGLEEHVREGVDELLRWWSPAD